MEIRLYRDKMAMKGDDPRQALMRNLWEAVGEEVSRPVETPAT